MTLWEIDIHKPNKNPNSWRYLIYHYIDGKKEYLTNEGTWTQLFDHFAYFITQQEAIDFAINKIGPQEAPKGPMTLLEMIRQYGEETYSEGYYRADQCNDPDSKRTLNQIETISETLDNKVQSDESIEIYRDDTHYDAIFFARDGYREVARAEGKTIFDALINLSEKIKELP